MSRTELYTLFAAVLEYPDALFRDHASRLGALLAQSDPVCFDVTGPFFAALEAIDDGRLEELYTSTFEVQGICCLNVGYAVFGEDYKRGQYMAEIKVLCRDLGIPCGTELPDHLPNILRLITKLNYGDASDLVELTVHPALEKMLQSFTHPENIYRSLLVGVQALLKQDFPLSQKEVAHV